MVIIGGGIAGISAAYALSMSAKADRITLLEAEPQLSLHTTGRSAALYTENYGAGPVRGLTIASSNFLNNPPDTLVDGPLLSQRGFLSVARPEHYDVFETDLAAGQALSADTRGADTRGADTRGADTRGADIRELDLAEAANLAPHIRFVPEHRAFLEPQACDIDVAGLHQAFVRGFRSNGGEIATSHRVDAATPKGDTWLVETTGGPIEADVLVNAAGAWGDLVAQSAGVLPLGLTPMRRTAFMVNSPSEDSAEFAFVADANHDWYLRPDGTQFLCSPADETLSEPCDAKPEELDVARTIELLNKNTHLNIVSVNSAWAGLRTFSPDRSMVIGPEPGRENFFWLVGQGGTGIQTSPAAGQLTADLIHTGEPGATLTEFDLDLDGLRPDRFRN